MGRGRREKERKRRRPFLWEEGVFPLFCVFVEGKNRMWRRRRGKARHDERKR